MKDPLSLRDDEIKKTQRAVVLLYMLIGKSAEQEERRELLEIINEFSTN